METACIEHVADDPGKENVFFGNCKQAESNDLVTYCKVCNEELGRETVEGEKKEHTPGKPISDGTTGYCIVRCTKCEEELDRYMMQKVGESEAAAEAAQMAARNNMPIEPATTRPHEAPTRPAPAPVPVPAPQRPAAPTAPTGIPSQPASVNIEMSRIRDVDSFMEDYTAELTKEGTSPAVSEKVLKDVLSSVNSPDPSESPMNVEEAVEALGGNCTIYRSNGREVYAQIDLTGYQFLTSFEQMKLQNKQNVDRYENPQPFEVTAVFPAIADLTTEEIADTMMLVYDPVSGKTALIQLDSACLNTGRNIPELKVTIQFPGLFAFIRK